MKQKQLVSCNINNAARGSYLRGVGIDKRDNLTETSDEAILSLSRSGLNV